MFFFLHRYECFGNLKKKISKSGFILLEKQRNDVSDIFTSEDMAKFVTRIPDVVSDEIYEWLVLQ